MINNWNSLGKPSTIKPQDFKEKLLESMENEIRLNYSVKMQNNIIRSGCCQEWN